MESLGIRRGHIGSENPRKGVNRNKQYGDSLALSSQANCTALGLTAAQRELNGKADRAGSVT